MNDTVDILLATYQGARFLDAQLESILTQTYPHFHIRLRDDGSNDETQSIIQKWAKTYPHQFTVMPSMGRLGIKGNFSSLMNSSQAPYVMFADQDDIWLPQKIEMSVDCIKEMERRYGAHLPLVVHTDLTVVDEHLHELSSSFWRYTHLNPHLNTLNRLLPQNVLTGCTMLMNRSLVELAYPIPQAALMHDWWVALTAACFGHIQHLNQSTVLYRQHGHNDTGAKPYSLWVPLKYYKKALTNPKKNHLQAKQLLSRYGSLLREEKVHLLKKYIELDALPFIKKNRQIVKYQFFKQGILRNAAMLLGLIA